MRKLHEDLRVHVLEQKTEIEMLQKRDAESQKAIATLETRLKSCEGNDSDLAPGFCNATIFSN
jgi:predicted nuclease with TOPRIM domain